MIDLGTGNNNKINWPMQDKQEFIDIVEVVYRSRLFSHCRAVTPMEVCHGIAPFNSQRCRLVMPVCRGARKGRGLVVSPKDYSTKYKY